MTGTSETDHSQTMLASQTRIMTYNVRYQNPDDGENTWDHRREQVATTIRFHLPDVVGLQEACPSQLDDLRELLPAFTWLDAGRPNDEIYGEYTPIGYHRERFTLESEGSFYLSETPDTPGRGWDAALPRLVKYARFRDRTTNSEFVHVNTHFDHRGVEARAKSAAMVRDRIDDIAADRPVVLTGDLNCRPGTEPYRLLTDRATDGTGRTLRDAATIAENPLHGPSTSMSDFNNLIPDKQIDHVLVTPEIDVRQHGTCSDMYDNGRFPSDHLPVIADLSLPEGD